MTLNTVQCTRKSQAPDLDHFTEGVENFESLPVHRQAARRILGCMERLVTKRLSGGIEGEKRLTRNPV